MAQDTNIPTGKHGSASFASETFGGPQTPYYGDLEVKTTTANVGASVDLKMLSVVSYDGTTIALATEAAGDAYGILTADVLTGVGETTTVDLVRQGHVNANALIWDATFDDDEKKRVAFEAAVSGTNILVGKPKYNDDSIKFT
jgi:hypothetical protein